MGTGRAQEGVIQSPLIREVSEKWLWPLNYSGFTKE